MMTNGDVIQSNVIFWAVLDHVQKKMALLDPWGHSASETVHGFSNLNILKFDIFYLTLT